MGGERIARSPRPNWHEDGGGDMRHRLVSESAIETMRRLRRDGALVTKLYRREQFVVEKRFGLCGEPPMTYREIGERLGICGERVRQLLDESLAKLGVDPFSESLPRGL